MANWKIVAASTMLCSVFGLAGAGQAEESILGTARIDLAASSEIEAFVCAYNEEGGLISEIVETAFSASGFEGEAIWQFTQNPQQLDLESESRAGRIVFPMYKPRCDDSALLSDHTAALCEGFVWSAPLFHVIMSGYVSAKDTWTPKSNSDLIGRTVCQPKGEVSHYLRERGLTDLNARLVTAPTPTACLEQVIAGESDIAILPMMTAAQVLEHTGLSDAIRMASSLDMALSVHAIGGKDEVAAIAQIQALDHGLELIRASDVWFDIVKEHNSGHDHTKRHAAAIIFE